MDKLQVSKKLSELITIERNNLVNKHNRISSALNASGNLNN